MKNQIIINGHHKADKQPRQRKNSQLPQLDLGSSVHNYYNLAIAPFGFMREQLFIKRRIIR